MYNSYKGVIMTLTATQLKQERKEDLIITKQDRSFAVMSSSDMIVRHDKPYFDKDTLVLSLDIRWKNYDV